MSEIHHQTPDDPYETNVDVSHTKLLYYACNALIQRRVASRLIGKTNQHVFMFGDIPNEEADEIDDLFVELPHNSPTRRLAHELTVETTTKGFTSHGRFAKHVRPATGSGYPTIKLTIERERHLESPLGRAFGSFVLRSAVEYTNLGQDKLLMRQPPKLVNSYDLASCKAYAEVHDELLWEEVYPYWANDQFNRQAMERGRFRDLQFLEDDIVGEAEPASIQEFTALMPMLTRVPTHL